MSSWAEVGDDVVGEGLSGDIIGGGVPDRKWAWPPTLTLARSVCQVAVRDAACGGGGAGMTSS